MNNGIDIEQLFDYFDVNKDKEISINELKYGLTKLNLNIDNYVLDYFVQLLDVDGNN